MKPGDVYILRDRKIVILPTNANFARYRFYVNNQYLRTLEWISDMADFESQLLREGYAKTVVYDEEML